jgi:hypothetical protein
VAAADHWPLIGREGKKVALETLHNQHAVAALDAPPSLAIHSDASSFFFGKENQEMWLPNAICEQIEDLATFRYIDATLCARFNKTKAANELRLLTGYEWTSKNGRHSRGGFKTLTVCYRDAYYSLIREMAAPSIRPKLRVAYRRVA